MAWRVWSKLCCGHKWLLLLSPLLLLFLTISVMTITLPLPLPPADIDRRSSRALSSAGEFKSKLRAVHRSPAAIYHQSLPHITSRTWRSSTQIETSKSSVFGDAAVKGIRERSHTELHRNIHKSRSSASFKRQELAGAIQHDTSHHQLNLPQFTVNTGPHRRIKPGNHSAAAKRSAQTYTHVGKSKSTAAHPPTPAHTAISDRRAVDRQADRGEERHTDRRADTQTHHSHIRAKLAGDRPALEKHTQHSGKCVSKEQQAVEEPSENLNKHHNLLEDPSEARRKPRSLDRRKALSKPQGAEKKDGGTRCPRFTEQDFPGSDHRRIRISPDLHPTPWISPDDFQKMELLSEGQVVSKARVPAHGQVLQVGLDPPAHHKQLSVKRTAPQHGPGHRGRDSHSERCQQGHCTLIKRTEDWYEVFAFHLDRVLGLNRSLPAVLRAFHSDLLPYRYIRGGPRPAVWWDPDLQHLADEDNDQNSVPLSWVQYQELLKVHCGSGVDQGSAPCVGVNHSEWGRLALFDFLLQVTDRLDRYCCGFTPDPTELCVENMLHSQCANENHLLLVHILVRKADPSRLVFIDNAGRPQQPSDNLNFRLVTGVHEFPERAISVLQSGCLEDLLLRSLYTDREFWESRGGASGLRPLIRNVEDRGKLLLQHIRDTQLQLERDL